MGGGAKMKHQVFSVATTAGETLVAIPESPLPFLAGEATNEHWATANLDDGQTPADWETAGLGPGAALAFTELGVSDPSEAQAWVATGLGPDQAKDWIDNGFVVAEHAGPWASVGLTPTEAFWFSEKGVSPVEAIAAQADKLIGVVGEPGEMGPPADDPPELLGPAPAESDGEPVPIFSDVGVGTTLADAGVVSGTAWEEAVTPVPEHLPVGNPLGAPLLVGGDDLVGASATIIAYQDTSGGPAHEVLFCTVNEDAEAKLLDALAPTNKKLVPVEVTKEVTGRLPVDVDKKIFDEMVVAAKSINHHLQQGDAIPAHTVARVDNLKSQIEGLAVAADPDVTTMLAHYQPLVDAMAERIAPGFTLSYAAGGKLPLVTAFEAPHVVTQTEWVPDSSEPTGEQKLAAATRKASRVDPSIIDGVSTWDGKSRTDGKGVEYAIDLPDGFTAVYHPYAYEGQNLASDHFSLRGQLEIHAPAGEGHGHQLVDVLGSLNLVNRPMNGAEAEWVYLRRNIDALQLGSHPQVAKAQTASAKLEESVAQKLMFDHAHEAVGLDETGIQQLAQRLTLEAEAGALPLRVRMVRDAVAKAAGYGTGQDLAATDAYRPTPRRCAGWMVFDRFDVLHSADDLKAKFGGRGLRAHITGAGTGGASILDVFRNGGVLASTERRRIMGASKNVGMSEGSDMVSGGAKATFVRVATPSSGKATIVWDDPIRLLRRTDWYAYPSDHFGSQNGSSSHSTSSQTRDVATVAGFSQSNNEVMFADGLDLLGADAPSKVYCSSASERDAVRKLLAGRGVESIGGRPVNDVIVSP